MARNITRNVLGISSSLLLVGGCDAARGGDEPANLPQEVENTFVLEYVDEGINGQHCLAKGPFNPNRDKYNKGYEPATLEVNPNQDVLTVKSVGHGVLTFTILPGPTLIPDEATAATEPQARTARRIQRGRRIDQNATPIRRLRRNPNWD